MLRTSFTLCCALIFSCGSLAKVGPCLSVEEVTSYCVEITKLEIESFPLSEPMKVLCDRDKDVPFEIGQLSATQLKAMESMTTDRDFRDCQTKFLSTERRLLLDANTLILQLTSALVVEKKLKTSDQGTRNRSAQKCRLLSAALLKIKNDLPQSARACDEKLMKATVGTKKK